jgi:hypothetical protein
MEKMPDMSFSIEVTDLTLHVKYYGDVDSLDVIQMINEPQFIPHLYT